jgi:hypothetical protein
METPTIPPTLLAAWQQLTPRHRALVLTVIEALAAEDRARTEPAAPPDQEVLGHEPGPADYATMIRNLAMRGAAPTPAPDAWLRSVGMFDGNPQMDEIWEAGRRIREAERAE